MLIHVLNLMFQIFKSVSMIRSEIRRFLWRFFCIFFLFLHFWELHYSKPKHRTKNIYPTSKLDSSLKIYVLKFQIGINDTFRVIRISVKAVFSIFSEVFRAYLPIQWDFWDSKNSFGNISSTSIRIYNVLNWKKIFFYLKNYIFLQNQPQNWNF